VPRRELIRARILLAIWVSFTRVRTSVEIITIMGW
jgi:hypothetical protein